MAVESAANPPCGDEAVRAKTGKNWAEWCAALDEVGAAGMTHKEIAAYLARTYDFGGWWSQQVTVGYERLRGRRATHQKTDGYEASGSKTVGVPIERLYTAWADEAERRHWLADPDLTIRKATPARSLRVTWKDGTPLDVMFYAKGQGRSQVTIQQSKLPDAEAVARAKAYWKEQLEGLKRILEG